MKTVIVSAARSLPALQISRALAAAGVRVVATDALTTTTAGVSRSCARYVRTASPRHDTAGFFRDVTRLLEEEKPALWIPTGEEIFYLARLRQSGLEALPLLAPSLPQLVAAHDKARFAEFARKLGRAPRETILLRDETDIRHLADRSETLVFKPVWSRGGDRVLVCPRAEELAALRPTATDLWIAQTYLPGEEICSYGLAQRGRLIAHTAYHPRHRDGLGAAIAFAPAGESEARAFAADFVEATGWQGQLGFDFRRDEAGALRVIECNPRATSGIHFLDPSALAAALLGAQSARTVPARPSIIALAMLTYGLAAATRTGRVGELLTDFLRGRDVIWSASDPLPQLQQIAFLVEVGRQARRHGISLHEAFTHDLEWDGASLEGFF